MEFLLILCTIVAALFLMVVVDSDEEGFRVVAAFILVLCMLGVTVGLVSLSHKTNNKLLSGCQQHLPRSEKCVLIAIPEQVEELYK
jgi:uncharacterized protein YqhQ